MPFDAVLMGSRMMVAKEAATAPAVKDIIVSAPGKPFDFSFVRARTSNQSRSNRGGG